MELHPRIGTFFILIAFGLLILFVVSVMGNETNIVYLFLVLVAMFLGFLFRRKMQSHESGRFGMVRRMGEQSRKRREERMSRKTKK